MDEIESLVASLARKQVREFVEEIARKRITAYLAENAEVIKKDVKLALDEKIRGQVQAAIAGSLPGTIDEVTAKALAKKG